MKTFLFVNAMSEDHGMAMVFDRRKILYNLDKIGVSADGHEQILCRAGRYVCFTACDENKEWDQWFFDLKTKQPVIDLFCRALPDPEANRRKVKEALTELNEIGELSEDFVLIRDAI